MNKNEIVPLGMLLSVEQHQVRPSGSPLAKLRQLICPSFCKF